MKKTLSAFGIENSGNWNSGNWNSGDRNSGDWNSGYSNSGDRNSGNRNSGNCNSGDSNSGDRNSGYSNSGDSNSGDRNSGNRNSGYWNSGDRNSGIFNTDEPNMRSFNKETNIKLSDFKHSSDYIWFNIPLNTWKCYSDLTNEEKKEHDYAKTTGGCLITLEYKDAWAKWWEDKKSEEMTAKIKRLPNFDANIFEEITGIKIDEVVIQEMTVEQVCKELGRDIKIIK